MTRQESDRVWRALSDPTRRRILDLLRAGPRTTGQLVEPFDLSRYAIMKHLTLLVAAGLVLVRRRGRERLNYLNAVPLRRVYERWVSRFEDRWAASLLELESVTNGSGESPMGATAQTDWSMLEIEQEITLKASRDKVFAALTGDINQWWAYRASPACPPVRLEPFAGGRFYEGDPAGDGGLWGVVVEIRTPSMLRIADHVGTFARGVISHFRFDLETVEGGTRLQFSHVMVGNVGAGQKESTDSGWKELFDVHLRAWVEQGQACTPVGGGCEQ